MAETKVNIIFLVINTNKIIYKLIYSTDIFFGLKMRLKVKQLLEEMQFEGRLCYWNSKFHNWRA